MGVDFYIRDSAGDRRPSEPPAFITLEDDAYYWFLYGYFENASLDSSHALIDLYGSGEIQGYQLDRLEDELNIALLDISARPEKWEVLVGWKTVPRGRDIEIWRVLEKNVLLQLIHRFLSGIQQARESGNTLSYVGD